MSCEEMREIPPYRHFKLAQPSASLPNPHSIHPTQILLQWYTKHIQVTGNTIWDELTAAECEDLKQWKTQRQSSVSSFLGALATGR